MPLSQRQLRDVFGHFSYTEDSRVKGAIVIEPRWIRQNIVKLNTPHGKFSCHRLVSYQLQMFTDQACAEGLVTDIGGIWVPRHILWNPAKPLSGHAFGCDIDINVDDGKDGPGGKLNYGDNSYQPPRLIELARQWGFEWGGSWRTGKDGMHFSCVKLVVNNNVSNNIKSNVNKGEKVLPELRLGMKGNDVSDLQRRLKTKGYRIAVDGIFGPKTAALLIEWQKSQGFRASGRADRQTWESLGRAKA